MRGIAIALEPWAAGADEGEALGHAHFEEVNRGLDPRRPYKLDRRLLDMAADCGALQIITARRNGELLGYLMWTVQPDPESEGLFYAAQGPWFLKPGYPRVAQAMWDRSIDELRRLGAAFIIPYHRVQGRSANLGRFFRRRGAVHIKEVYQLWIGA